MKKMTLNAAVLAGAAFAFSALPSYSAAEDAPEAPPAVPENLEKQLTESWESLQEKFKKVAVVKVTVSRDFHAFTNPNFPAPERDLMCSVYGSGLVSNNIKESAMGFAQTYQNFLGLLKQGEVAMSPEFAKQLSSMPQHAMGAVNSSVQQANVIVGVCQAASQAPGQSENKSEPKKQGTIPYSAESIRFDI
ncbi:MAG: hypothetical protein AUJ12_05355 [Alphaproteobacteria bacterium CG1_02_46_17]|nr:MAG: hypothetical protein AUJ12_05355 [Alphaproteobacteria bacterium CG1_02_46_17]